jgi:hypothetical protein
MSTNFVFKLYNFRKIVHGLFFLSFWQNSKKALGDCPGLESGGVHLYTQHNNYTKPSLKKLLVNYLNRIF